MSIDITNSDNQPKSKFRLIISTILILIIIGLIAYGGLVSYQAVLAARQKYYQEVANLKKKDIQITIIEGWRREQIAAKLADLGILSSTEEFLKASESHEGQLFPDTYRFFANSTAEEIVKKLTDNFTKKTQGPSIDRSLLILASIVEREAASDSERAAIAGVYQNRLDSGMMLEADPTAQFARDSQKFECGISNMECRLTDYWQPITKEEIETIESPYNSYKHGGLPPGPICNPGIKSIESAKNPEKHQFFYFFHAEDGQLILSRNITDHNQQKKVYGVRQ